MKLYSIKNIARDLSVRFSVVNQSVFDLQLTPLKCFGYNNERLFSIHQLELIKNRLEKVIRAFKIQIDFDKEEVFTVYESRMNYE